MINKENVKKGFIEYVLTEGSRPTSIYSFAKKQKISEVEFYDLFGSFDGLEKSIWSDIGESVLAEIKSQEVWNSYSSREKVLSFFYGFFERLKNDRSFAVYSIENLPKSIKTPKVFEGLKAQFLEFVTEAINEGLESGELSDRKFFAKHYKDALWAQFVFVLHFWIKDESAGFEKTDEAIEKGLNVTFDLFQRSPIDNLLDYGKFLAQNSDLKGFKFTGTN